MGKSMIAAVLAAVLSLSGATGAAAQGQVSDDVLAALSGAAGAYLLTKGLESRSNGQFQAPNGILTALAGASGAYLLNKGLEDRNQKRTSREAQRAAETLLAHGYPQYGRNAPAWVPPGHRADPGWVPPGHRRDADVCVYDPRGRKARDQRDRGCEVRRAQPDNRFCLRQRWTPHGWVTYYDKPCMDRMAAQHRNHDWRR